MGNQELRARTKAFALRVIAAAQALPRTALDQILGRQLIRSGTSIGANYREACRASSRKHFAVILEICLREADETAYWLELMVDAKLLPPAKWESLRQECDELVAIFVAAVKSARRARKGPPQP